MYFITARTCTHTCHTCHPTNTHHPPHTYLSRACRYENVVQIRCLYEGVTVQEMLDHWHDMLPARMHQWDLDRNKVCVCAGVGEGPCRQRTVRALPPAGAQLTDAQGVVHLSLCFVVVLHWGQQEAAGASKHRCAFGRHRRTLSVACDRQQHISCMQPQTVLACCTKTCHLSIPRGLGFRLKG